MAIVLIMWGASVVSAVLISILVSPENALLSLLVMIISLVPFVVQIWASLAMLYVLRDDKLAALESYRVSKEKLASFAWLMILTGCIIILGFMLLIIPGFLFIVWFSFAGFIFLDEGLLGLEALKRSKQCVSGKEVAVAVRLGFLILAMVLISLLASKLVKGLENTAGSDLTYLKDILLFGLVTPFSTVYSYLLYKNVKSLK